MFTRSFAAERTCVQHSHPFGDDAWVREVAARRPGLQPSGLAAVRGSSRPLPRFCNAASPPPATHRYHAHYHASGRGHL
jgi:hypothetical protein